MWRVVDRLGHLGHERRRGPGVVLEGGEPLGEVAPLDELHAEELLAVVLADLVDRHDPGVVQQGHRLGLVLEPAQLGVVGQHAGLDHLQRHRPVEADLPGLVDDAHAAAAQLLRDRVVAEVAHRRAAGQARRGVAAVGGPGRPVGFARPIPGGVGRRRDLAVGRPGGVSPVASGPSCAGWVGGPASGPPGPAVVASAGAVESSAAASRVRQRGQGPSGASAGRSAPQFGQRITSAIDGSSAGFREASPFGSPRGFPSRGTAPGSRLTPLYGISRRHPNAFDAPVRRSGPGSASGTRDARSATAGCPFA